MNLTRSFSLLLLAVMVMTGGCDFLKEKTFTPTQAEQKLITFCKEEGNLDIVIKRIGPALWIYAPIEEAIFDVKASPDKGKTERKVQPLSLLSVETAFSEKYFKLNYDVIPNVLAPEPVTYGSSYNETYTKKRQLVYQALQESFFNAKDAPKDPMPDFVVIMVTDITKGIATKSVVYLSDLKRYVSEALPPDEYYMREINEIIGQEALIQDKLGRNVPYTDITWPWFLLEQIKTRIKYKFNNSTLPADTDPAAEIAKAAANTLRFYPFKDYTGILLYDVRSKKDLNLTRDMLSEYAEKTAWEDEKRKITTIRFQLPKDPTEGVTINSMITTEEEQPK